MRARLAVLLSATLLAASAPVLTTSASAAAPSDVRSSKATTAAERDAALKYWTTDRKAKAIPGDRRIAGRKAPGGGVVGAAAPTDKSPQARPSKPGGGGGTSTSVTGATWTGGGAVAKTTGKVFFTLGGRDYVCSGSTVASGHDNLVLTAGHCLHEGTGGLDVSNFASNFAFYPGYDGTKATKLAREPYGGWASNQLFTTTQWADTGDFTYDVGFAVMSPQDAQGSLYSVVGEQPIAFPGATRAPTVHAFGYPAANPYDGNTLTYCSGSTVRDPYGSDTQGLVCNMTGGSSGGPWYTGFDPVAGVGVAYSVNSYRYTSGRHANKMFGPYFGTVIKALYETVD